MTDARQKYENTIISEGVRCVIADSRIKDCTGCSESDNCAVWSRYIEEVEDLKGSMEVTLHQADLARKAKAREKILRDALRLVKEWSDKLQPTIRTRGVVDSDWLQLDSILRDAERDVQQKEDPKPSWSGEGWIDKGEIQKRLMDAGWEIHGLTGLFASRPEISRGSMLPIKLALEIDSLRCDRFLLAEMAGFISAQDCKCDSQPFAVCTVCRAQEYIESLAEKGTGE